MSFLDHFSEGSALYAVARPTYPAALYDFVAGIAPARDRAWDCGTGNGQAAAGLARHFAAVEATDASAEQIAAAAPCANVRYSVQPAERTDFPPGAFDAVCVAQALHWFDFDAFYAEVRRVLRPGGVLVAWGYVWFRVDEAFDACFERLVRAVIHPYWPERNAYLWTAYRDIPFPFERIAVPELPLQVSWNFAQLVDYVRTWSGTRRCIGERGDGFLRQAVEALRPLWGDPARVRTIAMNLHVLAGRNADPPIRREC